MTLPPVVRPAAAVAAAWLAATLPLALLATDAATHGPAFVVAHVAALALSLAAAFVDGAPPLRVVADWLPLALVPLLYAELPQLMAGAGASFRDAAVLRWETAWFGDPSSELAVRFPWRWLSETLHLAYFLYYPLIYVPPALLYVQGRRDGFADATMALVTAFVLCFAVFVVAPVEGPRYSGGAPAPDGVIRSIVLWVLESGSSRGAAFPSSHVAVAVVQSGIAWSRRSRLAPLYTLVTALLGLGAVYGGFHYGIDVAAGALVGVALVAVFGWVKGWVATPIGIVAVPEAAAGRDQKGR